MASYKKVGLTTKYLSNRNYLNEVSVEGKRTSKFNFNIGNYDQYAAQIIRSGNCITLLTNKISIAVDTFWNTNYFEDISKFVFWTFNKSFLLKLIEKIEILELPVLNRCTELLNENHFPYNIKPDENTDEELQWCYVKNGHLKKDPLFNKMYEMDTKNRTAILEAIEKRMAQFRIATSPQVKPAEKQIQFLEMLRPINGSQEEALNFIIGKTKEAKFKFDIFTKIPKSRTGKNPYKLNGCIGAMLDFFYQHNYFKKEYSLPDIFKSFLQYSGNSIPKFDSYISSFRNDSSFAKHFENLKNLKINKLSP